MKRSMCTIYMNIEVYDAFRVYAAKHAPKKMYEVWEETLLDRITSKPVNGMTVTIQQQIVSTLPSKQEQVRMGLLGREINFVLGRLDKVNGGIKNELVERLGKLLMKGTDIKNPSEEFTDLLEEAMKHI